MVNQSHSINIIHELHTMSPYDAPLVFQYIFSYSIIFFFTSCEMGHQNTREEHLLFILFAKQTKHCLTIVIISKDADDLRQRSYIIYGVVRHIQGFVSPTEGSQCFALNDALDLAVIAIPLRLFYISL